MELYKLKPGFQKTLSPLLQLCLEYGVTPFQLNLLGLVTSITAGAILFISSYKHELLLLIPLLVFTRIASNALDGMVARSNPKIDAKKGNVINELFDRLSDLAIFLGITFSKNENVNIGFLCIILMLLNSYIGVLAQAVYDKRFYLGIMGKADRMFYLGIAAFMAYFFPLAPIMSYFLYFVSVGLLITIMQRLAYISRSK